MKLAIFVWCVFILLMVLLNGTLPFAMGADLHAWTDSLTKDILIHSLIYGGMFLVVPLLLTKGWQTVRRLDFLIPLLVAVLAITLRPLVRPTAALAIAIIAYLHWRFDLSALGIRSRGWRGDVAVIVLPVVLGIMVALFQPPAHGLAPGTALASGLDRLLANPASTVENLFYFGFLTERLSLKTGWWTPPLIGMMYTIHEMTNPEYWYEGMAFAFTFILITVVAALYLWRRSVVVIWLSDGMNWFVRALF